MKGLMGSYRVILGTASSLTTTAKRWTGRAAAGRAVPHAYRATNLPPPLACSMSISRHWAESWWRQLEKSRRYDRPPQQPAGFRAGSPGASYLHSAIDGQNRSRHPSASLNT